MTELDDELCTWPTTTQVYTRANLTDQWSQPVTPLTQDLVVGPHERAFDVSFRELGLDGDSEPWSSLGVFYGWVYVNLNHIAEVYQYTPGMNAQTYLQNWFDSPIDPDYVPPVLENRDERVLASYQRAKKRLPEIGERMRAYGDKCWDVARHRNWAEVETEELVDLIRRAHDDWLDVRLPLYLAGPLSGNAIARLAAATATHAADADGALFTAMLGGIGLDLVDSARLMDEIRDGKRSIDDFIELYGYRGPNEYELDASTWGENRERLQAMIADTVHSLTLDSSAVSRTAALDIARTRSTEEGWQEIQDASRELETAFRWREDSKVGEVKYMASLRLAVREAGRRLAHAGVLDEPGHVVYLRDTELLADLKSGSSTSRADDIARRHATREAALAMKVPHLAEAGPDGLNEVSAAALKKIGFLPAISAQNTTDDLLLEGQGVSPGLVTGTARVILDPYDATIEPGEVLVTASTDPAWTPLFAQAAAVVLDHGSLLSHGAMLAREIGIPCVVNASSASTRLRSGDRIEVNGGTGIVKVLNR